MTWLIPVLNPPRKHKAKAKRSKKTMAKKSYVAAARKAGAVYKSGAKKGKIMSVAAAKKAGKKIPGFTAGAARKKTARKKTTTRKKTRKKTRKAAKKTTKKTTRRAAPKKSSMAKRYRSTRKKSGKQPYTRTGYKKGRRLTWMEAAHASGAVYPAKYPKGHPKAGNKHSKAGQAMTKQDALKYQRPVVGYLSRPMIKGFYQQILTPGGRLTSSKKKIKDAYSWLSEANKDLRELRKKRGSAWLRAPQSYTRSGKTPKGKKYKKGARRPDYRQYWDDAAAPFQSGGGEHLRVKFRKGRGPVVRVPVTRGIGPSEELVAMLETGGFGGPLDAPGGTVKLNRGRRRRRKKARRKNPARKRTAKKRTTKSRTRRKKRRKAKAYNPKRRRKRRKSVAKNPRRRRKRRKKASTRRRKATAKNPKRRYRRKKSNSGYKKNPRRRRRRTALKRNPGAQQLAQFKSQSFWMAVAHIGVGMAGTAVLQRTLLGMGPLRNLASDPGYGGTATRFAVGMVSAGALSAVAYAGRKIKLIGSNGWLNILVGGAVYSTANLLGEVFHSSWIPSIGVPRASGGLSGYYDPLLSYGSYPGQYPGMGAIMSPEDLVAGESLARNVNEFSGMNDWMELSGLGSSGGTPVPLEDFRGYPGEYGGGMNDWVEFNSGSGLVQAGFNPGAEAF